MKSIKLIPVLLLCLAGCTNVVPPAPYGAIPSDKQVEWQKLETYMFIHFGPNTFTDVEWGDGKEDPKVFNPTQLDCRQWASIAKAAGMKGIIITAKHHDGFCLFPSDYSTHTVRESKWKDGKGDVLKELSDACREYGLKFGVYLSPWDQNHPSYGTDQYNDIFAKTLEEVHTRYGEVFEQWFDGANGEGHGGKKQVYDWDKFYGVVYKYHPRAMIFSDIGPDCRWMGNEKGVAGETNWSTLHTTGFGVGIDAPPPATLNTGNKNGEHWIPAEVDVSIRPGWFYSPKTDDRVKTLEHLVDIYYTSVGRNGNLLLNVPPDRRGLIHPNDSARLMELRKVIDETFAVNLIEGAEWKASNSRGAGYEPTNMMNGNYDSYWATTDEVTAATLEITLPEARTFNRLLLQEYIPLGQRVEKFSAEYWNPANNAWEELTGGTTIGYKRILRFPAITTDRLRISINESLACPLLNNIGLYKGVEFLSEPTIWRDKKGMVTISCSTSDPIIYYTTDGTEPSQHSKRYTQPFEFTSPGVIKAVAWVENRQSTLVEAKYDVAPIKWRVQSPATEGIENVIDGLPYTAALLDKNEPLVVNLGETLTLAGFSYIPVGRTDAPHIYRYNFYVSENGRDWKKMQTAVFNNIKNNPIKQEVLLNAPVKASFIKLEPLELTEKSEKYAVAEIEVITK